MKVPAAYQVSGARGLIGAVVLFENGDLPEHPLAWAGPRVWGSRGHHPRMRRAGRQAAVLCEAEGGNGSDKAEGLCLRASLRGGFNPPGGN